MDLKAPQELWNPRELWNQLSKAVPGKFHWSGRHCKSNCLQDRANFDRSLAWQTVLIFNTAIITEKPAVRLKSQPTPKAEKPKKTAASSATPRTGATTKTTTTGSDDEDDDEEEEETESETDTTTETESDSEGSEHTPSPFTATGRAKSMG